MNSGQSVILNTLFLVKPLGGSLTVLSVNCSTHLNPNMDVKRSAWPVNVHYITIYAAFFVRKNKASHIFNQKLSEHL